MDFPRIVIGYHGCTAQLANELLSGARSIADWPVSRNVWDWLGWGIYFWEFGPARAQRWAEDKQRRIGRPCTIIAAVIQLGTGALDLTDIRWKPSFEEAYKKLSADYAARSLSMPVNAGADPDRKRRVRDCLVIDEVCHTLETTRPVEAVRGAFEEGDAMFEGSNLREETHLQLAVRDPRIILGVFKPS